MKEMWARMAGPGVPSELESQQERPLQPPQQPQPQVSFLKKLRMQVKEKCDERIIDCGEGSAMELSKELRSFRKTKTMGVILEKLFCYLKGIPVSSVESERSFSTAGRFCSKFRSSLGDRSLNSLTLLQHYYKNH